MTDSVMSSFLRTPLGAAFIRAHHFKYGSRPLIFEDSLAHTMLYPDEISEFRDFYTKRAQEEISSKAKKILDPPAAGEVDAFMRNSVIASEVLTRQRYAEDALRNSERHGVVQYVILGAGMDTYSVRNPLSSLSIFEVDRMEIIESKKQRILASGLPMPRSFFYVSSDFQDSSLFNDMLHGGFRPNQPTFFSWLGVTPYLTLGAIRDTLLIVDKVCGAKSEIVFDYTSPDALVPETGSPATIMLAQRLRNVGQPLQLSLSYESLQDILVGTRLRIVEHLGPSDIYLKYMAVQSDNYPMPEFVYFVRLVCA